MKPSLDRIRTYAPLFVVLLATPFVIWGAISVPSNTADITQWLPDGNTERRQYDRFVESFGADNFVLVSWPGCTLEDERLDRFAAALRRCVDQLDRDRPLLREILTAPQLMQELTGAPLHLSRPRALARMRGTLVGPDGNTAAMLVQLASATRADQHLLVDMIFELAPRCGLVADELRLGGTAYKAVMIERESERSMRRFVVPSCLVALLVAGFCLRNLYLTTAVLTTALFAELVSLALVYCTGGQINAVMIVMPPLIFVLTISSAMHLINYYRDALRDRSVAEVTKQTMKDGGPPVIFAATTTALGLMSLGISAIAPVRQFGLYAGLALLCSLIVTLLFLPAALRCISKHISRTGTASRRESVRHCLAGRRSDRVALEICQRPWYFLVASLLIIGLSVAGLFRLKTTVKLERSFTDSSRFVRDYHWLEQHIGPLISVELLVRFDETCRLGTLDRLELMAKLHQAVRRIPDTDGVVSPVTFAPPIPRGGGLEQTARRGMLARNFNAARSQLISKRLIAQGDHGEVWRLSARVPAMGDFGYRHFIPKLQHSVQTVMRRYQPADRRGLDVTYTGLSPLIDSAQHQLMGDLISSFLLACVLICPVMMLILRNFWGGLLSMVPNVVPVLCVFGTLGWLNISIDIGAVLTASVALGIAVDDTLHFLTWFSRGLQQGMTRVAAVRQAYRRCATAMIQTTLICGLGILVFALSTYTPASRFGWLIAVLLLSALGSDLILLPAMLASPLGRAFERGRRADVFSSWRRYFPDSALSVARLLRQRLD